MFMTAANTTAIGHIPSTISTILIFNSLSAVGLANTGNNSVQHCCFLCTSKCFFFPPLPPKPESSLSDTGFSTLLYSFS